MFLRFVLYLFYVRQIPSIRDLNFGISKAEASPPKRKLKTPLNFTGFHLLSFIMALALWLITVDPYYLKRNHAILMGAPEKIFFWDPATRETAKR